VSNYLSQTIKSFLGIASREARNEVAIQRLSTSWTNPCYASGCSAKSNIIDVCSLCDRNYCGAHIQMVGGEKSCATCAPILRHFVWVE
jgi:hypothetical protein